MRQFLGLAGLVVLLAVATVEAAGGVKGYPQQREEIPLTSQVQEQAPIREEQVQLHQEAPSTKGKFEARPQLSRDDIAKGETLKAEHRDELASSGKTSLRRPLEPEVVQLKQEELKQEELKQEALELPAPIEEVRVEQQRELLPPPLETKGGPVKGYEQREIVAPIGEAEPYAFSYAVDGSARTESGDTRGVVRGQYSLQQGDGSSRIVDYIADANGFRASVSTNEFGTEPRSPAGVALRSSQPSAEDITLRLEGKTREDLRPRPAATKGGAQLPVLVAAEEIRTETAPAKGLVSSERLAAPKELPQQKLEELPQLPVAESAERKLPSQLPLAETSRQPKALETKSLGLAQAVAPFPGAVPPARFESITAHRVAYPTAVQPVRAAAIPVPVRAPLVPSGARPAVVRSATRVHSVGPVRGVVPPPAPVQHNPVGYRRNPVPRVGYYSAPVAGPLDDTSFEPAEFY